MSASKLWFWFLSACLFLLFVFWNAHGSFTCTHRRLNVPRNKINKNKNPTISLKLQTQIKLPAHLEWCHWCHISCLSLSFSFFKELSKQSNILNEKVTADRHCWFHSLMKWIVAIFDISIVPFIPNHLNQFHLHLGTSFTSCLWPKWNNGNGMAMQSKKSVIF